MSTYDEKFYQVQSDGSYESAVAVLPLVFDIFQPESVIDVGCGVGTWLAAAEKMGIRDLTGLDGDYVDLSQFRASHARFIPTDLAKPFAFDRQFDLAISVEVAEHLSPSVAQTFVSCLTKLSQFILFSAAAPGQGGTDHRNEQWPTYWAELFASHQYYFWDCLRPAIWTDSSIGWCYRQNLFIVCHRNALQNRSIPLAPPLDLVHPKMYDQLRSKTPTILDIPSIFRRSVRHWLSL